MSRFFSKKLPRLALGAVVILIGVQGQSGLARTRDGGPESSGWTVGVYRAPEGGYVLEGSSGDLRLTKAWKQNGEVKVQITDGTDTMIVDMDGRAVTVSSHGESATLAFAGVDEGSSEAVKTIVHDSPAAQKLEASLSRELQDAQRKPHVALAMTHALLRQLEGDDSAVRNLGRYLTGRHGAGARAIRFVEQGCYESYERGIGRAFDEFEACIRSMRPSEVIFGGGRNCTFRYLIWAEGLWFEFLSCSAVPLK